MAQFTYTFDYVQYKGTSTFNTGLFINGTFVKPVEDTTSTINVVNPVNGKIITAVSVASAADVEIAVNAAQKAYKTSWGLSVPGAKRGRILNKLADLLEKDLQEFAALEALDVGKSFNVATLEMLKCVEAIRYFAGWADKVYGKTIEAHSGKFAYTRREPYGVVGAIIPWNLPLTMLLMKLVPAVATGNTVVLKPSEVTPLTALKFAGLVNEAGFPPGVINIVNGLGPIVGAAIASHPRISKVSFTGSVSVGRKIQHASADSNLKSITLDLGGKSPNIIFDDANMEQALKWSLMSLYYNSGQVCYAGTRIYVQEGIYDTFVQHFLAASKGLAQTAGDPFESTTQYGPVISQVQYDRVMSYIESGKEEKATLLTGGNRIGDVGFYIEPTIFADTTSDMKIVKEEIFGPVGVIIKFSTEEEVIEAANNSTYGLSCSIFTENSSRSIRVAHALEAGTAFVNLALDGDGTLPFGGYKQSGTGRELGEEALSTYTQLKAVHVNVGMRL